MELKIIRVKQDIHKAIKMQAIAEEKSLEKLVTEIIEKYLAKVK